MRPTKPSTREVKFVTIKRMAVWVEAIPLTQTETGDIFLEGSRIPLETLVLAFNSGDTPEDFVSDYPHLKLADVYAVLSYYLRHREEVDAYVAKQQEGAEQLRQANPYPATPLRHKVLTRRAKS